jgi:phage N-6-adenine-methyltransferase
MTVYNTRTEHSKDDWETPPELFWQLDKVFHFNLDTAANEKNKKCKNHLADALTEPWGLRRARRARVWCNPPFSKKDVFLERAMQFRNDADHIVFLLPNNSRETAWWNSLVVPFADQIINLIGRVNFYSNGEPTSGCNFPSCLVVYRPRLKNVNYGYPQEIYWDWKRPLIEII